MSRTAHTVDPSEGILEAEIRRLEETRAPDYIAEGWALDFLEDVLAEMRRQEITRAELARRMGVSRSAVTQMFDKQGHNLTLLTMARLAAALEADVDVRLRPTAKTRAAKTTRSQPTPQRKARLRVAEN